MLTANLAFTPGYEFAPLFAYPPMDPLPYQWEYLMDPGRPQLRLSFDAARQRGGLSLWTSFVDGTLDGKPEHYREFLEFLRQLERCEILARFDPEGEPDPRIHALVVSVPIQALTVREMLFDDAGTLVRDTPSRRRRGSAVSTPVSASNEPPPGHTRKETEGVFVIRDGIAVYVPVKVGIAGEQYFEVIEGLEAGDMVITGPFASVRELGDGEGVRLQESTRRDR
jgi:hypothetical protein